MTSTEAVRRLWRAFCEDDLAELLTRIALFFSGIVLVNSAFTGWILFSVATDQTVLLVIVSMYLSGFFLIMLSLLTRIRAARLAFVIPVAIALAVAASLMGGT